MIEGRILFPGKDFIDQFGLIIELLGTPEDTQGFIDTTPHRIPIDFRARFIGIDSLGTIFYFELHSCKLST